MGDYPRPQFAFLGGDGAPAGRRELDLDFVRAGFGGKEIERPRTRSESRQVGGGTFDLAQLSSAFSSSSPAPPGLDDTIAPSPAP
jgi:hypothetical protein